MNNLNKQENIPNPSQPVILPITAEVLQAEINSRAARLSFASKVYGTTGIASALYIVYNGSTIFTGLEIPSGQQIFREEISMISPDVLGYIDYR